MDAWLDELYIGKFDERKGLSSREHTYKTVPHELDLKAGDTVYLLEAEFELPIGLFASEEQVNKAASIPHRHPLTQQVLKTFVTKYTVAPNRDRLVSAQ